MDIYDTITADTVEQGDQILIDSEPVEVKRVFAVENPDDVCLIVWSYDEGDVRRVTIPADKMVDLWSV